MNERKQPTEYIGEPTYQTGSTKPPKSHVGLVTFLLSAVIFFCGISTILSLMRINLLQRNDPPAESNVAFASHPVEGRTETCPLGIQGLTLPVFWQEYRALPQGVLITYAHAGHGVNVGDIVQAVDGKAVTSWDQLLSILEPYHAGDHVAVTVYRNGANRQIPMIIER